MFTDRRHGELAILAVTFAVSSIMFQKHLTLREIGSQKGDGLHITFSEKGQNLKGDIKISYLLVEYLRGNKMEIG